MKPHADAVAIVLMLGDTPDEQQIRDAFAEAGIDRNVLLYLAMMGFVRRVGAKEVEIQLNKYFYRGKSRAMIGQYKVTPKGLELLE